MSECRGPECSHPSHDAERRRREFTVAELGRALERGLIPCIAREVAVLESDGRLTIFRTGPAPRR